MSKIKLAVQVYSVQEEAQKDFAKTMKIIKEYGYDGVELAGLYGIEASKVKEILKENDLIAISAHVPYEELRDDLEKTLSNYKEIGCKYIIIPYLTEEKRYGTKEYEKFLEDIKPISAACKKEGFELLYHNHEFEFIKTEKGVYVLDELFDKFSEDELGAEMDVGWITASNVDPIDYIKRYDSRTKLIHIKDCLTIEPPMFIHAGAGIVDIKAAVEEAKRLKHDWLIVEIDGYTEKTPLENIRLSVEYLNTIL